IDEWAPLYYVRKDTPPILLITGDREKEMLGRYEENAYFYRMMKVAGQDDIELYEMDGYGHLMSYPGFPLLLDFVKERTKK
ncbi:MAG: alpha/beta hydrolase, partial [Christiangramia sp.]|nr:alpha/beta hydrolase [Christiangramia sp.]